jgi:hypothetical protein
LWKSCFIFHIFFWKRSILFSKCLEKYSEWDIHFWFQRNIGFIEKHENVLVQCDILNLVQFIFMIESRINSRFKIVSWSEDWIWECNIKGEWRNQKWDDCLMSMKKLLKVHLKISLALIFFQKLNKCLHYFSNRSTNLKREQYQIIYENSRNTMIGKMKISNVL